MGIKIGRSQARSAWSGPTAEVWKDNGAIQDVAAKENDNCTSARIQWILTPFVVTVYHSFPPNQPLLTLNALRMPTLMRQLCQLPQYFHFLLLAFLAFLLRPFLPVSPATNPFFPRILPLFLMFPFPLSLVDFLIFLALLPTLFLHLRFYLLSPASLGLYQYLNRLLPPFLLEAFCLQLWTVEIVFVLPYQEIPGVSNTFVYVCPSFFIKKCSLSFVQSIKCIGCLGICGLVRMYQERLLPVCNFDVRLRHAWLEVKNGIAVIQSDIE